MKPSMLKFAFGEFQMEILISALKNYKTKASFYNDVEVETEIDYLLIAFEFQLKEARMKELTK